MNYQRGQVLLVQLGEKNKLGSEQKYKRPVIVVQNDIGNRFSSTLIVIPITSKVDKKELPTHVLLHDVGIFPISLALCEQITTIDKQRVIHHITYLKSSIMCQIDHAIKISLDLI